MLFISPGSFISTDSAATRCPFHIKIAPKQWMAFLTMPSIPDREIHSAHGVYLRCGDFQMHWIHALFISAKMIALQMVRNWTKEKLPNETMGIFLDAVSHGISPVSIAMSSASPHPATRPSFEVNLFSKTRRQRVKINTFHIHPHGTRKSAMGAT